MSVADPDLAAAGEHHPRASVDLIGHAAAVSALAEARQGGRLHHGWLICGPRGIGKATLAYRFARALLAGAPPADGGLFGDAPVDDLSVDAESAVFRQVLAGSHPDLLAIERGFDPRRKRLRDEIVVDDVREMGGFLALTPAMGGWRIVIVDAADEMNRNAANAILKLLEEPPARALVVLVSHNPGRLLPTIRSRCRQMPLRPLAEAEVAGLLARFRPELDAAEQAALVSLAEGSIGRAILLADAGGLDLYRQMIDVLADAPRFDIARLYKLADDWARTPREAAGDPFEIATDLLLAWLVRVIHAAAGGGPAPTLLAGE
ncbi:MAG: DNA polymerase III subunit delta', partial [Pseudomonadota bacterium]|nr:DNA polymerase III subunit delta' [Pseudomonadota bacterium]